MIDASSARKVVVVTGASAGVGRAVTRVFARRGWRGTRVVIVAWMPILQKPV